MNREELERRLNNVEVLISESKETVQSYKQERKQLKKQLEELPKLEVGKWYKRPLGTLLCYDGSSFMTGYGFNSKGTWIGIKYPHGSNWSEWTPATDKEVETALIAEAKKKEYKDGNYKCLFTNHNTNKIGSDFRFEFQQSNNTLWIASNTNPLLNNILRDGKWATIIKDKTIHLSGDYTKEQLQDEINKL